MLSLMTYMSCRVLVIAYVITYINTYVSTHMLNHVICLRYPFVMWISGSKLPKHLTLATWLLMSYGGYPFYTTNPSYKQLSRTTCDPATNVLRRVNPLPK